MKLGARSVTAMDIDPIAAEVARANCEANGIGDEVALTAGTLTPTHAGRYPLAVSNISTDANIGLGAAFAAVVGRGGRLILSGILSPDAGRVQAAMAGHGFRLTAMRHERDWCLLEFVR